MAPYSIETNSAGRKVLAIKKYFDIDATDSLNAEDFDIVFIDTPQYPYNTVRLLLGKTSPLISNKCRLKPRFLTIFNRNDFTSLKPLIDGFAQSAIDDNVTSKSEDILRNISSLGIKAQNSSVSTEKGFFLGISQYCLSRGLLNFTDSTIQSLKMGLSAVYAAYVDIHETIGCGHNPDDRNIRHMTKWLLESEYIEPVKFVERIHMCPECHSSLLLFSECCRKCNSSNLREEDMIHHFRCANISPESEYMYDDQLRCPKCKRFLQHIGIDYDRPAKVQTCLDCGETQMLSAMKAICAVCGNTAKPSQLISYDIKEYTFTQKGMKYICSQNM